MIPARIAIIGGGCAGLSLARALVAEPDFRNTEIVIYEARTAYVRDRTWCFWSCVPHRFEAAIAHRWNAWSAADDSRAIICESERYTYCQIPSDRFYDLALGELRKHANVSFRLGVPLASESVVQVGMSVFVNGETTLPFDVAYDSRPIPMRSGSLLQHFVGWEIVSERPVFDERVAMLMDFRRDASSPKPSAGTQFTYVLPTTRTHALVESTFFSTEVLDTHVYESEIRDYLSTRYSLDSTDYAITNRERGVLPMDIAHGESPRGTLGSRVHRIGVAGGAAKPSSGYAFLAIQQIAAQLSSDILNGRFAPRTRTRASRFLDDVFLRFVREHPLRAPAMFTQLFKDAPPDSVARFMSEVASPLETLRIVNAMPKLAFTRSAAATLTDRIVRDIPLFPTQKQSGIRR